MTKQNTFYVITFWDKCDTEVASYKFKSEAAAIEFVKKSVGDPKLSECKGWSLTEGFAGRFFIEVGEDIIPLH